MLNIVLNGPHFDSGQMCGSGGVHLADKPSLPLAHKRSGPKFTFVRYGPKAVKRHPEGQKPRPCG